jgi:frataxin-like iron-binding protein CyaY
MIRKKPKIISNRVKKNFVLLLVLLLGVSVLAVGCGKKTTNEKISEKMLEESLGSNADVDIEDGSIKIETDEGTFEAGGDISLSKDWPEDIHVTEGKIIASQSNEMGNNLTIESDRSVDDVKKEYKEKLEDDGWEINMTFDMDDNVLYGAEKDERTLSLTIGKDDDGKTMIVLVQAKK